MKYNEKLKMCEAIDENFCLKTIFYGSCGGDSYQMTKKDWAIDFKMMDYFLQNKTLDGFYETIEIK